MASESAREELIEAMRVAWHDAADLVRAGREGPNPLEAAFDAILARRDLLLEALGGCKLPRDAAAQADLGGLLGMTPWDTWTFPIDLSEGEN